MIKSKVQQIYLALNALMLWFALGMQFVISTQSFQEQGRSFVGAIVQILSYYTVQTNTLIAVALTAILFFPRSGPGRFFSRFSVLTAIAVYILIVGLIYATVLKGIWELKGLFKLTDVLLHEVSPVVFLFFWLVLLPKESIKWSKIFSWALFPFIYLIYCLIRGACTGDYPYPFVNAARFGYTQVMINSVGVLLLFLVLSSLLILISRFISGRKKSGPTHFILLFISASCLVNTGSLAQNIKRDTSGRRSDSLRNAALDKQSVELQRLKTAHEEDSLRRQQLQAELAALKSTDNLKKAELQDELKKIRSVDSLRRNAQRRQIDSLKRFVKGFPVQPFFDTLFVIYSKQGSFTAEERAAAIAARIHKLADDFRFHSDSIQLIPSERTIDLAYRDNLIVSLSEEDALWQNTTTEAMAGNYKARIGKAVAAYRQETSWQTLAKEIGLAALVIAAVVLVIMVLNRLFARLKLKVESWEGTLLRGIHLRNYELFNSRREVAVIHSVLTVIKWMLILLTIYLALPVLFGIFPWTRNLSETLISYVTSPLRKVLYAIWNYLPNFMTILVLVVIFRYIIRFFHFLKTEVERGALKLPGFYADWANPTFQIIRVLILAFMLIVIFPYMPGSDSPIFKGVSVFVGVLFTFGSAGALSNVVAGLVLTYMRAFRIGDRVRIGDATGDIIERSLLVTRIRTIKNEIISVPNSAVMSSHTVNYSSEAGTKGLIIHTTVTIGYDIDWRRVYELLKQAANKTGLLEAEPEPFILQLSLDDYYVSYQLNAYTKHPNKQAMIYSTLFENIQDVFHEAGIEIMSPHFYALRDGHKANIPESKFVPKEGNEGIHVRLSREDKDKE